MVRVEGIAASVNNLAYRREAWSDVDHSHSYGSRSVSALHMNSRRAGQASRFLVALLLGMTKGVVEHVGSVASGGNEQEGMGAPFLPRFLRQKWGF